MSQSALEAQAPYPWQDNCWQRLLQQYQNDSLPHAILLSGPGGIGKYSMLKQFARTMLCLDPEANRPCGHCHNCQLSASGEHPDILVIEPAEGARDITIEQVRGLSDFVQRTGHTGVAKIAVIRHAHRMNQSAANALLKTLEEPTRNTFLFLETELPGYLSATIRSRCQRISMSMPELGISSAWLDKLLQPEDDAAALLATVGCRPMRALELAESGELQERQQFSEALRQLLRGDIGAEHLVTQGNKIGVLTAVEAMSVFLSTLITDRLERHQGGNRSAGLEKIRCLFDLYAECLQARKQLLSAANPNPQLILETLLWHLAQLPARSSSPRLPQHSLSP